MAFVKSNYEEVTEKYPHLKEFSPFLETHNSESHRGSVLVCCSFLDEQLKDIIDAFLLDGSDKNEILEGFNAPIGTFSARIKMAHCLGLISDEEKNDCEVLRKIRNEFAHNHRTSFKDQKLIDLCGNLYHSAKNYNDVVVDAFGQYSSGAVCLILNLINRPHYVGVERLRLRRWKY